MDESKRNKINWSFCPICGKKIPKVKKVKFCVKCGVDLSYIQEKGSIPPNFLPKSYVAPYSEYLKISDDKLLDLKHQKLWSSLSSLGIPFISFILMNMVAFILIAIILILNLNTVDLYDLITNPYVTIFSSLAELVFIIIPVLFVGKYLQNPSLNNRLTILGFTTKGYNKLGVIKEILLGIIFAVIGVFLVVFVSLFMEVFLELIFGTEIVYDVGSSSTEIDAIIYNADIVSLSLLLIIMILVIGTSEEVLFRGFMQKGLVRTLGLKWGIIMTALIFSMIHLIGIFLIYISSPSAFLISFLLSFFPYFAISLMLGLVFYWRKENLIAVMVTHGVYDALTILLAFMYYNIF
jgi:membrane protease YdiL (CAAX protease family)